MPFGGLLGSLYANVPEPKGVQSSNNVFVNPVQYSLLTRNRRIAKKNQAPPVNKPETATSETPTQSSVNSIAVSIEEQSLLSTDSPDLNAQLLPLKNEYDPSIPNNYTEVTKKKKREQELLKAKLLQEEMLRLRNEQFRESVLINQASSLEISGEEAYNRRKQLSSAVPSNFSTIPTYITSVTTEEVSKKETVIEEKPTTSLENSSKKSFAQKILEKMGWKEGEGLGKEKQGIVAPLVARKTDTRSGVIVEGGKKPVKPQQQNSSTEINKQNATRVILLTNIVGRGEVDEDLKIETTEEAAKFGNLLSVKIVELETFPDDACVRIFLEYENSDEAIKAYHNFHNRLFDGRIVKANFYNEELFTEAILDRE